MPALNFVKQFAPGVRAMLDDNYRKRTGIKPKTTTILAERKRPIKKGDTLYLYTGMRTKYCQRLGTAICKKAEDVRIEETSEDEPRMFELYINDKKATDEEFRKIALADGFSSSIEFFLWFKKTYGMPFTGQRIHMANTYDRKYYLNRKVKEAGFDLKLEETHKTIIIPPSKVNEALKNRYVRELRDKYNYGIQTVLI